MLVVLQYVITRHRIIILWVRMKFGKKIQFIFIAIELFPRFVSTYTNWGAHNTFNFISVAIFPALAMKRFFDRYTYISHFFVAVRFVARFFCLFFPPFSFLFFYKTLWVMFSFCLASLCYFLTSFFQLFSSGRYCVINLVGFSPFWIFFYPLIASDVNTF